MLSGGGWGRAQTRKDMKKFFRSNNRSLFCMLITFHTWITHFTSEPRRHNWAAWASAVDGYGMCAARQCDDDNDDVKWASLRLLAAGWRWQWSGGFFRWTRRRKWGFSIPKDLMTDKNSRFSFTILILIRSTLKTFPSGFTLKVMGLHSKRLQSFILTLSSLRNHKAFSFSTNLLHVY